MTDYTVGDTFRVLFTTRQFSTGTPFTLAGTPVVSAIEDESATPITAGITLGVDHASITGLNRVTVVASGANGFESGKDYHLVITTGTVDSVSVVGEVVGRFTLGRSAAAVDLANGTDGLGAIKATADAIEADTQNIQSRVPAALVSGRIDASVGAVATNAITAAGIATDAITADKIAANAIGASELAADAVTEIQSGLALEATLGTPAGASVSADIAAVKSDTGTLVTRITSTLFSGITSLAEWLGLLAGKQTGDATARTELRATGAGSGTYDETTDSNEAIRDTAPLGTAMRGTDNAALASVATEARLAELDAANLPADVARVEVDTQDIQSRIPAALVSGKIDANMSAINGGATDGNNATLSLKRLSIINNDSASAVEIQNSSSGTGLRVQSGTSDAASFQGGTNSAGIHTVGSGTGPGLKATGGPLGSGSGMEVTGIGSGSGIKATGGATGHGVLAQATAGNGRGVYAIGNGAGAGIQAEASDTASGFYAVGGATSGSGITAEAQAPGAGNDGLKLFTAGGGSAGLSAPDAIVADITGNLSGSVGSLATQAKADVNAEVDAALDTAVPVTPTAGSVNERLKTIDDADIPGRLPVALTAGGKMDSDATAISGDTTAADNLEGSTETIVPGAAIAGTLSTTQMTTDLTEATNDHYNGRTLIWRTGVLAGQATDITDYDGATKTLTFTAVTEAPGIGDTFVIV